MRADQLKSPGILSNGQTLRHQTAHAISRAETNLGHGAGDAAAKLIAFFDDCSAKVAAAVTASTPTAAQTTIAIDDNTLTVGQEATVTLTVKNSADQVLNNVPVVWSLDAASTAAGRSIVSKQDVTSNGGVATCVVKSTDTGTILVDADIAFLGATFNETVTATVA